MELNRLFEEVLRESTYEERVEEVDFETELHAALKFSWEKRKAGELSKKLVRKFLKDERGLSGPIF